MSKIGKKNIEIPKEVKVVLSGNVLNIEGPKGKRSLKVNNDILEIKIEDLKISVRPKDKKNQNNII